MLKVEPNIIVDDINMNIDDNAEYSAEKIIDSWGPNIPIVKINDIILPVGNVIAYDVMVDINQLLSFSLDVDDDGDFIKNSLKSNEYNKVTIFVGSKHWYHKYNGIILNTNSSDNNFIINFDGIIFAEQMFDTEQIKYDEKTVEEILIDICGSSDIGLFSNENESLSFVIPEIINSNLSKIEFIKYIISNFTNNIFSFDSNYILHVGNLNSFIDKNVSKINYYENKVLPNPIDLIISNEKGLNVSDDEDENLSGDFLENINKLVFNDYNIDDIKGSIFKKDYSIVNELNASNNLYVNDFGIGDKTENYFSGFKNKFFPNYNEIVNKQLIGKIITITMDNNFYEIFPFMSLNLEIYTKNPEKTQDQLLDEQNSGKKTLIGYSYHYKKNKSKIIQRIKLI